MYLAALGTGAGLSSLAGPSVMVGTEVKTVPRVVQPKLSEMGVAELTGFGGRAVGLETSAQLKARLYVAGSPEGAAEAYLKYLDNVSLAMAEQVYRYYTIIKYYANLFAYQVSRLYDAPSSDVQRSDRALEDARNAILDYLNKKIHSIEYYLTDVSTFYLVNVDDVLAEYYKEFELELYRSKQKAPKVYAPLTEYKYLFEYETTPLIRAYEDSISKSVLGSIIRKSSLVARQLTEYSIDLVYNIYLKGKTFTYDDGPRLDPEIIYTYLMFVILAQAIEALRPFARYAKDRFKYKMIEINYTCLNGKDNIQFITDSIDESGDEEVRLARYEYARQKLYSHISEVTRIGLEELLKYETYTLDEQINEVVYKYYPTMFQSLLSIFYTLNSAYQYKDAAKGMAYEGYGQERETLQARFSYLVGLPLSPIEEERPQSFSSVVSGSTHSELYTVSKASSAASSLGSVSASQVAYAANAAAAAAPLLLSTSDLHSVYPVSSSPASATARLAASPASAEAAATQPGSAASTARSASSLASAQAASASSTASAQAASASSQASARSASSTARSASSQAASDASQAASISRPASAQAAATQPRSASSQAASATAVARSLMLSQQTSPPRSAVQPQTTAADIEAADVFGDTSIVASVVSEAASIARSVESYREQVEEQQSIVKSSSRELESLQQENQRLKQYLESSQEYLTYSIQKLATQSQYERNTARYQIDELTRQVSNMQASLAVKQVAEYREAKRLQQERYQLQAYETRLDAENQALLEREAQVEYIRKQLIAKEAQLEYQLYRAQQAASSPEPQARAVARAATQRLYEYIRTVSATLQQAERVVKVIAKCYPCNVATPRAPKQHSVTLNYSNALKFVWVA